MLGLRNFEADVRRNSSLNILRTRVWEKNRASAKFRSERPASFRLDNLFKDKSIKIIRKTRQKAYHGHKLMFSSKLNSNFIQLF
jgi:hypothetical protein